MPCWRAASDGRPPDAVAAGDAPRQRDLDFRAGGSTHPMQRTAPGRHTAGAAYSRAPPGDDARSLYR